MTSINPNLVVSSLGRAVVGQLATSKNPDEVKTQFAQFSAALDAGLRPALAAFVKDQLAANDDTRWMANVLAPSVKPAAEEVRAALQTTLASIKGENDRLHDKTVKKGIFFELSDGASENWKTVVGLPDVAAHLEAGGTLKLRVFEYEKIRPALGIAIALVGEVPTLNGVMCGNIRRIIDARPIKSAADLANAWQDAKLA